MLLLRFYGGKSMPITKESFMGNNFLILYYLVMPRLISMAALWKRVITKGLWGLVKTVHINFRKCKWLIKAFWCLSPKTKIIQGRIDSNKTTAFVCDIPERRCKIYFIMKLPKVLDKWFICRSHSGLARKLLSRVARIWCKYEMETR